MRSLGKTVVASWVFAVCIGAACGGSPVSVDRCGDGTSEQDGECVAIADAAAAQDVASTTDAFVGADSTLPDAGEAGSDASDAAAEGDAFFGPPDPCVSHENAVVLLDCDTSCCGADSYCHYDATADTDNCFPATCSQGPMGTLTLGQGVDGITFGTPFVVRTPNKPGVDPACASRCPGAGFVYGLGFDTLAQGSNPQRVRVSVGAPWVIIHASTAPYCPNDSGTADEATGCWSGYVSPGESIYVMTADPNAPARNITFLVTLNGSPPACPSDGGA